MPCSISVLLSLSDRYAGFRPYPDTTGARYEIKVLGPYWTKFLPVRYNSQRFVPAGKCSGKKVCDETNREEGKT